MKYITLIVLILIPFTLTASTSVLPVVASTDGHAGSVWKSAVTLFNVGHDTVDLDLEFIHSGTTYPAASSRLTLLPGEIWRSNDILEELGSEGVGFLIAKANPSVFERLDIQARTFVTSENGTFGQSTPFYSADKFHGPGSELYLSYPESDAFRFNFGITVLEDALISWKLVDSDGITRVEKEISYSAPTHEQYNNGLAAFFGIVNISNCLLKAEVLEGKVIVYGSTVDNITNDGTFQAASRLKNNILPHLVGIDTNGDGSLEYVDANGDGVLDATMVFSVSFQFGFLFKIEVMDSEGDPVSLSLVNPPTHMFITDPTTNEIYFDPDPSQIGLEENLEVVLNDGLGETTVLIPLQVTH